MEGIIPVAHIENDFTGKFGIPRQSGMNGETVSRVVFEKRFASPDAIRGIEGFSHLWLIWIFSENEGRENASLTVRPPRLGGNTRVGVFASRAPFRPNPIGLSCVKLMRVEYAENGAPVLYVAGADLMNGTPIADIKPYVPYTDCHPEAAGGFSVDGEGHVLRVCWQCPVPAALDEDKKAALDRVLSLDPRPSYQRDGREYGLSYAYFNVRFSVDGDTLSVLSVQREERER